LKRIEKVEDGHRRRAVCGKEKRKKLEEDRRGVGRKGLVGWYPSATLAGLR
jgi:hypothetical protein